MKGCRVVFGVAMLALAGCHPAPTPDGLTLLARSHRAEETLPYTTREINEQLVTRPWPVVYGRPVTTLVARTEGGPGQERQEVLYCDVTGADAHMVRVRSGERIYHYIPSQHRLDLSLMPITDMGPLNWYALILHNYTVEGVRADHVAGTAAWYLEVRPRYAGRPLKRLWLDQQTYLPLRQELWGPDGVLIAVTEVVARPVQMRASNAADFAPPVPPRAAGVLVVHGDEDRPMDTASLARATGFHVARLTELPPGFRLAGQYLHYCPDAFGLCARWELTDGIASVSVIQTRARGGAMHDVDAPEDVQGNTEILRRGDFHFIVRGNLSAAELLRIARGIHLDENGARDGRAAASE